MRQNLEKIVISKSVTGSINKEQAEKVISFKVTNNSTKEVNTYSLKDFNYDESNKMDKGINTSCRRI